MRFAFTCSLLVVAAGTLAAQDCVRYVVPYNYVRVCGTASYSGCLTGQTSQCGNPETSAICVNKDWRWYDDDYNATVKEQRNAASEEEGRLADEANPDHYECWKEGDCECEWEDTFWQCQGGQNENWVEEKDVYELSGVQCFG
ncbi:hypothetical protein [Stieleria varia]|uniref:Uncharacterized protein n=1 Tax=Stieleria varia TaxID=2528005 RepID=A0A5C6AJJ6_9BACT|nr:hypothetical protein [Stieleria varia]TWT98373.1 hypothetical protein Pla52n_48850 [Stieleria varia]